MKQKFIKNLSIFLAVLFIILIASTFFISSSISCKSTSSLPFSTLPETGLNVNETNIESDNQIFESEINNDSDIMLTSIKDINDFKWVPDLDSTIGNISFENSGRQVTMTGNGSLAGKNAVYFIPPQDNEQIFKFSYDVDYGDSFIAAGVLLRVALVNNNTLQGYLLSFNNPNGNDNSWYTESGNLAAIWKFTYILNTNTDNTISKELVKSLNIAQSGTIQVDSTSTQITFSGDYVDTINIDPSATIGNGFGFFTTHYSHNCTRIGHFILNNFAATIINIEPHDLIIDPNGGTWKGSSSKTKVSGKAGEFTDIPLPVREGYTFLGWQKSR